MHINPEQSSWSVIFQNPEFQAVARKRKKIVISLFLVSALFYFSIPLLTTMYPAVFRVRLFGSINLGLVYAILQYPIGGLIAYYYAISMRKIDREIGRM
jgi:uncharacterized membrane protein (DUF485 family)